MSNADELRAKNIQINSDGLSLNINFDGLGKRLDRAQFALDSQVWQDVQNYMPLDTGALKSETNILNQSVIGSGKVYLYPPQSDYGHYQYEGVVYVDPQTGKAGFLIPNVGWRSRKGVKKVPSDRFLQYSQPNAERHWGEAAIRDNKGKWVNLVKRVK